MLTTLTADQLRRAADIREQIESLQAQLDAILREEAPSIPASKKRGLKPGKRQMSSETKAKMAEAQRRRWAKQ